MSLFQTTVVAKYLKSQDTLKLNEKWDIYKSHFLNPIIQENIRNSKEEQYQEGFLRDLFVKILGYTLNPENSFNLTTELKNLKDSKKADGGIIINDSVVGVVELKGTNTTDLGKVEEQAFGYKNNQPECVYVITSNFEKLRFYIDNAIEHIEFNLFTLTELDFKLLYLCLGFENVKDNIPKKLKEESLSQEELITKQLYKDYSLFKRELFQNLCELNPQFEPLELFKKSQKLLDRCLFLFFAEDRNLLPPNSVRLILDQWKKLQELDAYTPLYDRFKKYFGYLNTGFKGKQYDVFPYNGGLFKPDEVLDNITINDDLLYKHSFKLSEYDFESEVDVNILGHIFENSLNELDEITAQLEGQEIDKSNTKRKKDGVFYTPKYITKYIVENTIGKLCEEKKAELDITDEAYQPAKQRSRKRLDNLNLYRNWLLQLTICDPACGSGAFLNQALDFLINEHRYIDELSAKYNKDAFILSDVEKSILENNLFGVDLNEESVEIAKLSLWLRTAQPNRKLNDLSDNIKCGNSLIDDISVAGDKAFNWEKEFPQIFAKGGFDVIIGNPPYVLCQPSNTNSLTLDYYKIFIVASYKIDLFHLFFEKSINILRSKGKLGFITPNTYLNNKYIKPLREYILYNTFINSLINYKDPIFIDAGVDVATIVLTKNKISNERIEAFEVENSETKFLGYKKQSDWNDDKENIFSLNKTFDINLNDCITLKEICSSYFGIQAYDRKSSISNQRINENYLPIIDGGDINKYSFSVPTKYFNFLPQNIKSGGDFNVYIEKRIVISQIGFTPIVGICESGILGSNTLYNINLKDKSYSLYYLLCVLNSSLIRAYWISKYSDGKKLFPKIKGYQLKELPIKKLDKIQQKPFINKAEEILNFNKEVKEVSYKFQRTLQREFEKLDQLSKKLESWYELTYAEFLKELKKKKIELSLSQKAEWEDYFLNEQKKALDLQNQITSTDQEIDTMVYKLYGLNEVEISIIKNS